MDLELEVSLFITIVIPIFLAAFIMYMIRAIKGPTVPDIVLAIDCLSYDLAAFLALLSIYFKSPILIPCAMVLALWIYALDVYVSKYLSRKEMGE